MMSRPAPPASARRVDLHTHTTCSDGLLEPQALVKLAEARGLAALAITDHDSLDALPLAASAHAAIELVPGIEISSALDGSDLHILGYFVDPGDAELARRLQGFRADRIDRAHQMVERLERLGAPIEEARVRARATGGVVGRPHLAAELVEVGHAVDAEDAFRRFLAAGAPAYVPRPAFHPSEAIQLIHSAGGVSVLAHAGSSVPDRVIESLAEYGLRGLEIWHPQHGATATRRLRSLAHRLDLIETGGSDFHGTGRSADLGEIYVPITALTRLKEAAGVSG